MKKIVVLIDYFGTWPKWMPVFLASCRFNSSINWVIRTDCEALKDVPDNVKIVQMRFDDYVSMVSHRLGVNFNPANAYKICDLKPMLAELSVESVEGFDYFGFGDLDVIYGDIRKFCTDEVLECDVISTHRSMISGHFALFKNNELLRTAYARVSGWQNYIEEPVCTRFDEDIYSCLFMRPEDFVNKKYPPNLLQGLDKCERLPGVRTHFVEQYTTVFHPMVWHDGEAEHPEVWYWSEGRIYNERNSRDYIYLHLMNFQSMRWVNPSLRQSRRSWCENPDVRYLDANNEISAVRIDWDGIHALR